MAGVKDSSFVCHVVSIRKREDPGNEILAMSVRVGRAFNTRIRSVSGVVSRCIISTCFLGAINL